MLLGADPDKLEEIAMQFDAAGAGLGRTYQIGRRAAHSPAWSGPDAQQFRQKWDSTARLQIQAAERMLASAAKTLRVNAMAQRHTSEGGTGAWGTAPLHPLLPGHQDDLKKHGVVSLAAMSDAVHPGLDSLEQHEQPAEQSGDYMRKIMGLKPGAMEIITIDGPPPRYVVLLKGIDGFDRGDGYQTDLPNAALEKKFGHSDWSEGVKAAMRATIPPGSDVMIMGHSGGGIVAANLAGDERFNGPGGYHVTDVVVAGSGVFEKMPGVRGDTNVLMLQHGRDVAADGILVGGALTGVSIGPHVTPIDEAILDSVVHPNHVPDVFLDTTPIDDRLNPGKGTWSGHDQQYYEHELRHPHSTEAQRLIEGIDGRYATGAPASSTYFRLDDRPGGSELQVQLRLRNR